MRRLIFLTIAAIMFFGCEGPMGAQGPMGPQGEPGEGMNWDVSEWTVNANQWILSGGVNESNSRYYADINDPNLTEFIAENGNIFVYLFTEQTTSGWVQTPLPYVTHKSDGTAFWTETYDFDFTTGSIRIYVQYSDFLTEVTPPTCTFRVVKNW